MSLTRAMWSRRCYVCRIFRMGLMPRTLLISTNAVTLMTGLALRSWMSV
uniref:Uncharacterized protein n=1 Tax=Arundo donax TaxID=35708 RepID=A0A0A9DJS7_ARUDO